MKRVVNLRCFIVNAIYLIATLFTFKLYTVNSGVAIAVLLGIFASAILFMILFAIFSDKKHYVITFVLALILSMVSFVNLNIVNNNWINNYSESNSYKINGQISRVSDDSANIFTKAVYVELENLIIDSKPVKGKMKVRVTDSSLKSTNTGYYLTFNSKITCRPLFTDGVTDGNAYRTNIRYSADVTDYILEYGKLNVRLSILQSIEDKITQFMGKDYGAIAFSMFTGDKNGLADSTTGDFSTSGLGHLMAVSGLHISFMIVIFRFIFVKLRVPRKIYVPLILFILVAYVWLIGISPSVLRAIFMAVLSLFVVINGRRNDSFNSLGFAVTVILVIFPMFMFELGFVLSVSAVFGLIIFAKPFGDVLAKLKFPRFLRSIISLPIAVQIGVLPVFMIFFNELQLYSIPVNIIAMPMITIAYIFFVVSLPFAYIPGLGIFLSLSGTGIGIINDIASTFSALPLSMIFVRYTNCLFLMYPLYFLISRFVMMGNIKKFLNIGLMLLIIGVFSVPFIDTSVNKFPYDCAILPVSSSSEVTSVVIDNGKTYIVGDFLSSAAVKRTLKQYCITKVDSLIVFSLNDYVAGQIIKLKSSIKIGNILCPENAVVSGLDLLSKNEITNFYIIDNNLPNIFKQTIVNGQTVGYTYSTLETNVLLLSYSADYTKLSFEQINSVSTIRCFAYFGAYPDRIFITDMPKGYFADDAFKELSLRDYPDMIYLPNCGSIAKLELL